MNLTPLGKMTLLGNLAIAVSWLTFLLNQEHHDISYSAKLWKTPDPGWAGVWNSPNFGVAIVSSAVIFLISCVPVIVFHRVRKV